MKISQAAEASGCHLETIRYYEKIGLLPHPTRTDSGYRAYTSADIERLRFIARGRDLGFSLEEIRQWLLIYEKEGTKAQRRAFVDMADRQRKELEAQRAQLQEAMTELAQLRDITLREMS